MNIWGLITLSVYPATAYLLIFILDRSHGNTVVCYYISSVSCMILCRYLFRNCASKYVKTLFIKTESKELKLSTHL